MGATQMQQQPINKLQFLRLVKQHLEPPKPEPKKIQNSLPKSSPSQTTSGKPKNSSPEQESSTPPQGPSEAQQRAYEHLMRQRLQGERQQQDAMQRWRKEHEQRRELQRLEQELHQVSRSRGGEWEEAKLKQAIWRLKNRERLTPEEIQDLEAAERQARELEEALPSQPTFQPPAPEGEPQSLQELGQRLSQSAQQVAERVRRGRGSALHQFLERTLVPHPGQPGQEVTLLHLASRLLTSKQRLEMEVIHNLSKQEGTEPSFLAEVERQLCKEAGDRPEALRAEPLSPR